jgi:SNF2 family DNA or RNA helicase
VCNASLSALQLQPLLNDNDNLNVVHTTTTTTTTDTSNRFVTSTKIDALVSSLQGVYNEDPTIKSVVFSQFTSMLDLVEKGLELHNINYVRLDGSMAQSARVREIERFRSDPTISVFLISMKAGGLVSFSFCRFLKCVLFN